MLRQMREWFQYLKWLLLVIVVMFVWWAFYPGGGRSPRGSVDSDWAARVNGEPITATAFQNLARQYDSRYQSLLGEQYAQQRSLFRVGQQAIDRLIEDELMYQEAVRQGLTVSEREVADAITRDPGLQENGKFIGLDRYRTLFRGGRTSLPEYEEGVRRSLMVAKLRSLIEDGVSVDDDEVEREFLRRNEKAAVDYIVVEAARGGPAPSDTEVQAYYQKHLDRYTQGEGRTGLYVLFDAASLAASQTVSDEAVRAAYEANRDTRYTTREQRRASHILFKVDAGASADAVAKEQRKALEVLKKARAGADFAQLAKTYSQDSTAANGGDLGYFGRGQMVKAFEDAAFSLPVGGISDLVRSPYGFHIIKVTDSREGRTIPFEEAEDGIRRELQMTAARAEMQRRSKQFADAAAGGRLEAVAKSQGLVPTETGPVRAGDALPSLPASQPVVTRMLALQPGTVSEPIDTPSGPVVVQVTGIVPPEPSPLDAVRSRVEKDLLDARLRDRVEEAMHAAPRGPAALKTLARSLGTTAKSQADLAHGGTLPGVPATPEIEHQVFSLEPGTLGDPIATSAGVVVLSVRSRDAHRDQFETQKDSIRDALVRQRQDRLYRAFVSRLRQRSEVVVNDALVSALDRA
jgi:peptidyl-prolyl cis-trans isomerase D